MKECFAKPDDCLAYKQVLFQINHIRSYMMYSVVEKSMFGSNTKQSFHRIVSKHLQFCYFVLLKH
jgi:hypothetical protein